jgi:hypothetical protein
VDALGFERAQMIQRAGLRGGGRSLKRDEC